ncbi:MAG: PDZ domain-containing protein [Lachnospiraceae bacterium]|jgi:serine protease Do|nr:PDZ domain-containing protein [Lachnospiraceae bacterium]
MGTEEEKDEQQFKQNTDFLTEKIKERPVNKKKLLRRTVITVGMAVLFGLVACVTFSLLEPVISNQLNPEEPASVVQFPEEVEEVNPQDMPENLEELQGMQQEESLESETAAETATEGALFGDDIDPMVAASSQLAGYEENYGKLAVLAAEVQKSMVGITAVYSDSSLQTSIRRDQDEVAGVLVANNGKELLILADAKDLKNADSLVVTFETDETSAATIKGIDYNTGLAVIAVNLGTAKAGIADRVRIAELGSSMGESSVGTAVMAIGAPTGRCGSVCYGMVTGQNIPMELTDSDYREMTTDIYGSSNASGAIVNMKGQVIGVIYPTVHEDMPNQICGIGITELKKTIERLSNKESIAYLGIQGGDVTTAAHNEYGTPYGAYVTSVNMGSPAMKAGIQSGDVISKCDTIDIMTYSQLVTNLTNYKADDTATLTVFRQQGDSFQEMEVEVTFTVQKNTTN